MVTGSSGVSLTEVIEGIREELARLAAPDKRGADGSLPGRGDSPATSLDRRAAWITTSQPVGGRAGRFARMKHFVRRVTFKLTRWQWEPFVDNVRGFATTTAGAVDALAERLDKLEQAQAEGSAAPGLLHADLASHVEALAAELTREIAAIGDRLARVEYGANTGRSQSVEAASAAGRASGGVPCEAPDDDDPASGDGFVRQGTVGGSGGGSAPCFDDYADVFREVDDILDVGCGRGELLKVLTGEGKRGRGVDANPEMVEICVAQGLDVTVGDGLTLLEGLSPASLGGVAGLQVVEHLTPTQITRFVAAARRALRPGGVVALKTVTSSSLGAVTRGDAEHAEQQPLLAETLRFVLESAGFLDVQIVRRSGVPEGGGLRALYSGSGLSWDSQDSFDGNGEQLKAALRAPQDFAVIARA